MFTGLVEGTGRIQALNAVGGDVRIVCLTALAIGSQGFAADVSKETLRLTSLGAQPVGGLVNLEKALLPSTRMGGHFVSGHVDGLAQLIDITSEARSQRWQFQAPQSLMRFIAVKGSVCLDGVSLTVNSVEQDRFSVNLIPHTIEKTNFAQRKIGDQLNLEIDLIARYLARFAESADS
jgi:riboflavin synthase